MAGNTICRPDSLVVEISWRPGICVVAGGTWGAIVVSRFYACMTKDTIRCNRQCVVEDSILPAFWCVTGHAIARVVFGGFVISMAGFTPGRSSVINAFAVAIRTFQERMFSHQRVKIVLDRRAIRWKRDAHWVA